MPLSCWGSALMDFLVLFFCGGKTQIRLTNQYHIGVILGFHTTSGFIRAQRGQIGTTCDKYPFG